ncbi:MAG: hypothetical protein PHQ11_14565 [Paludibacter sp.]|nr:hypothetical protein [Paludibacter sp.]
MQEERPLKRIADSFKKVIITRDTPRAHYTEDGFLMMNVFEFLLNPKSLDY